MKEKLFIASIGENAIELVKENGLGLELDHVCMAENMDGEKRAATMAQIRADIEKAGLGSQLILHAPFNELHPAAIDPKAKALAKERITQAIELARELGIKKLVVHSGYLPFVYFKSYHIEQSAMFWTDLMKDQPEDIMLHIENVLEDEPQMMADLLDAISEREKEMGGHHRYGICLDVGHAACMSQVPVVEWIRTIGARISHCHLHNNDGTGDAHGTFDCENAAFDMKEALAAFEKFGASDMTYTIEALKPEACLKWLADNGSRCSC